MRRAMITVAAVSAAFVMAGPVTDATAAPSDIHATANWSIKGPAGTKASGTAKNWYRSSIQITPTVKARGGGWQTVLKLVGSGSKSTTTIPGGGTVHIRPIVVVGKKVTGQLCVQKRGHKTVCGKKKTIATRR